MTSLKSLLSHASDLSAVASHLDGLAAAQRLAETRELGLGAQRRLYELAAGWKAITLEDLVADDVPAMQEIVHHGRNTLPAFNNFAKVFVRPDEDGQGEPELWGYNRNSQFLETVVGPGYFVCHAHSAPGELLVNYLRVPPRAPAHWPAILPNSARLSRFVYNGTQDVLRGVSEHVTIGRATKAGKDLPAFFVLCREA